MDSIRKGRGCLCKEGKNLMISGARWRVLLLLLLLIFSSSSFPSCSSMLLLLLFVLLLLRLLLLLLLLPPPHTPSSFSCPPPPPPPPPGGAADPSPPGEGHWILGPRPWLKVANYLPPESLKVADCSADRHLVVKNVPRNA